MVKKLYKHEFLAYAKVMTIVYAILLTVAAANRIIQIFESDTDTYLIVSVFSGITYGFSVFLAFTFTMFMGIVRFYKNLFSSEGYLTFTLPVTTTQHISVKVVTAVVFDIITLFVALISVCIVSAGELLSEIWKALAFVLKQIFEANGIQAMLIGLEIVIFLLVGSFASTLLYYTFISIGQLFNKNRLLAAIGTYFVFYIISQILITVLTVTFSQLAFCGIFVNLVIWICVHPYAATHIGIWSAILLSCVFAFVEFIVIRKIITNKLNLE